jgi:putative nucleotidyltransferase with HDIG domain
MALAEEGGAIDAGSLWRHSVISAVAAGTLAKRVGLNEAECFTAGLLHDVGKLIFASAEPVIYESIVGHVGSHGAMLIEMERSELGMTHAAVGARLLERWGLPVNVQKGVRYHHRPAHAPAQFKKIAAAMEVANVVAHQVDSENDLTPTLAPGTMQAMHVLGLNPEQFADVIRETESGLKRMEELLNLVKPKTDPHGFPALVS